MRRSASEIGPWHRRGLTIPPDSLRGWVEFAAWELWIGMLLCGLLSFGALLIITAPNRIVVVEDFSSCYATTVVLPCERMVYRLGGLNAAFSVLVGLMLVVAAVWLIWELWSAVEPKPITDDFLKLLHDSFGRNWRDPRTWPWSRIVWAYGFTVIGATLTAGIALIIWSLIATSATPLKPKIETTHIIRLSQ
jgi:hypothetical protein